jgi:hypothetical protein
MRARGPAKARFLYEAAVIKSTGGDTTDPSRTRDQPQIGGSAIGLAPRTCQPPLPIR